jgi:hypothetical protein
MEGMWHDGSHMMKYITGAVIVIVVLAGGYYFLLMKKGGNALPQGNTASSGQMQVATSTYATSTFSVVYPSNYTVDESYTYTQVNPKKPISGVKFTIPGSMATGTNLASDTYVSVEMLPHAKKCTGDIYVAANVRPQTLTDTNGVEYSVATSSGAAAGNLYEETVYALTGSSPCTAVRYWIHSSNIANYTPGTVQEFNRDALLSAFDTIRRSLMLGH